MYFILKEKQNKTLLSNVFYTQREAKQDLIVKCILYSKRNIIRPYCKMYFILKEKQI